MFSRMTARLAVMAAMLGASIGLGGGAVIPAEHFRPSPPKRPPNRPHAKRRGHSSTWFAVRHGARECARRRWQMYGREVDREAYLGPRRA
jgi:hypothetical protein